MKHISVVVNRDLIGLDNLAMYLAPDHEELPTGAVTVPDGADRSAAAVAAPSPPSHFDGRSWEEVEKAYALYLLEKHRWHITRAAREAGVNRSTFDSRLKRLGLGRMS